MTLIGRQQGHGTHGKGGTMLNWTWRKKTRHPSITIPLYVELFKQQKIEAILGRGVV